MGASTWASDKIAHDGWHENAYLHPSSPAFKAGVVTETLGEVLAGGLPGAMKHLAEKAVEKEAEKIAFERGAKAVTDEMREAAKKRLLRQARQTARSHYSDLKPAIKDAEGKIIKQGDKVHHAIALLGHPGKPSGLLPSLGLPSIIRDSRHFTTVARRTEDAVKDGKLIEGVTSDAAHAALHRGLRKQEAFYDLYRKYGIPTHLLRNAWKLGTRGGGKE